MQLYKHRTHLNYQIANLSVIWVHPDVITPEPCFPVLLKSPMHCGEKNGQLLNKGGPPASCTLFPDPHLGMTDA